MSVSIRRSTLFSEDQAITYSKTIPFGHNAVEAQVTVTVGPGANMKGFRRPKANCLGNNTFFFVQSSLLLI